MGWMNRAAAAVLIGLLAAAGCQSASNPHSRPMGASTSSPARAASPAARGPETEAVREAASGAGATALQRVFAETDAEGLEFHQHVTTLADPFFEGRSADTRGNALAAEYIQFYFDKLGLTGVFGESDTLAFNQPLTVPGDVVVEDAFLAYERGQITETFEKGVDFDAIGLSGSGEISGPLVFVGYSIEDGPQNYSNYGEKDDLTGKIAVMFRFEPMTATGESKWGSRGGGAWSEHSGLLEKITAAASRGASALIVINPPGAADPRARELESPNRSRFSSPVGIPVALMTASAGSRLLKAADPEGRDVMAFRKLADAGTLPIMLEQPESAMTIRLALNRQKLATNNVGGVLRGKGALADQYLVIGAHYDHVGYGYVGGARPSNQGQLHPGADDNASGTAALLMLARRLSEFYASLPEGAEARSILFLAFTAEEMGLLGSDYFVKNSPIPSESIYAMINIDMVGRLGDLGLEIGGVGTAEGFEDLIRPAIDASGLKVQTTASGIGPSDHASFHRAGTSVLFFFTGTHPDYHQPGDVPSKVNVEGAVRVIGLIDEIARLLATRPEALVFKQTSGGPRGPSRGSSKVRLGIMPGDYSGDEPGVLVGDVSEGTSAANGGMLKGDRMMKWDGRPLAGVQGMMIELAKHNPGDVVEITVLRDGQEVVLSVTLQAPEGRR